MAGDAQDNERRLDGRYFDVVIVGCGVAGLFCALNLPRAMRILMLSKRSLAECNSMLAQGGMAALLDASDEEDYIEDTLRAGHYANRRESVRILVEESPQIVRDLVRLGVRFAREANGTLARTREAAHSKARVLFHEDITGREITECLLGHVIRRGNVTILENAEMVDLIEDDGRCVGAIYRDMEGTHRQAFGHNVVLATGGVGGMYPVSTNFPLLTGDGVRVARMHGAKVEHLDWVQIHPTTLYTGKGGRAFLISESARGEGAHLLNAAKERFVDELLPRDLLSRAIFDQMSREGSHNVWLSFEDVPRPVVLGHFKHIYQHCLDEGYDILREPIPVAPAQHYFMGGIWVDEKDSRTSLPGLYAVGETSCNGVHGRNRLASNSLLDALVFSKRAARAISREERERHD